MTLRAAARSQPKSEGCTTELQRLTPVPLVLPGHLLILGFVLTSISNRPEDKV
jgi:hypothetical protein